MADDIAIDIEDDRLHVNATERTPAEKDYIAHVYTKPRSTDLLRSGAIEAHPGMGSP